MQERLQETIDHLRQDIVKVDEPQLKAMFETSAEVLGASRRLSATTSRRPKPRGANEPGTIFMAGGPRRRFLKLAGQAT